MSFRRQAKLAQSNERTQFGITSKVVLPGEQNPLKVTSNVSSVPNLKLDKTHLFERVSKVSLEQAVVVGANTNCLSG